MTRAARARHAGGRASARLAARVVARVTARGVALACCALALVACADERVAPPVDAGPLTLRVAADAAPRPERRVHARFDLVDERQEWEVEAPLRKFVAEGPEIPTGGPPMLVVGAGRRDRVIRLTRAGSYDPSRFDRVELWLVAHGGGGLGLAVDLWRDGKVVLGASAGSIDTVDQLVKVVVDLPPGLAGAPPFDALSLRPLGALRRFSLREVALVHEPPAARLPDADVGAELLPVGEDARRAVGLVAGRDLEARFTAPPGARLRLEWAWPERFGPLPADGATLRAELSHEGAPHDVVVSSTLRAEDAWASAVLPLSGAGGAHTLRLQLLAPVDDAAAPPACLLAVPELWAPRASPPTVLLITSDTHRADHVAHLPGAVALATPTLDALAARGTSFADAWTSVNNTNPSHVALMTGTSPRDTRVLSNYDGVGPAAETLAEVFARAGWSCVAALSTRHLGPPGSGLGQGFSRVSWPRDTPQRGSVDTLAALEGWLDDFAERPLFVWLHLFDAHTPYTPPADAAARHWDPSRDAFDPALPDDGVPPQALPPDLAELRDVAWGRAMYRAEVETQDARLGAFLAHPRFADALVALVGDHGELLGENGVFFNHVGAYPKSLHVPLIVAGPGVPSGRLETAPVSHLDLGRTLLELARVPAGEFPGRALPFDAARPRVEPRFALEAFGASATVRVDDLFLVLSLAERDLPNVLQHHARHQVELYDLSTDPTAAHDLVDTRPDDARRLRALLIGWLGAQRRLDWRDAGTADPEQLAELAALGYLAPTDAADVDALWQPDACAWCARFDG